MQIKSVPPAILTAATSMLQAYVPDLTPKSLVAALKNYGADNRASRPAMRQEIEKPYTRAEVCELLGLSFPTLNRYIKSGRLRKICMTQRAVRIDPASVREFLQEYEQ